MFISSHAQAIERHKQRDYPACIDRRLQDWAGLPPLECQPAHIVVS